MSLELSESNKKPDVTDITQDELFKMLRLRYPGMPPDVAEYIERYKDNFIRGEL
ncbi:MAG: hypothetical protein GX800_10725 [Clostridiaceae bacterium]|nr:hypothetical protein [Clostridiaceae bacterium]